MNTHINCIYLSFYYLLKSYLTREGKYFLNLGTDNFTRMDNILDKIEDTCKERVSNLSEYKKSLKEVEIQIGKQFPKEDEFKSQIERLAVLNAELDTDGKKNDMGNINSNDKPSQNSGQKR